MCAIQYGSGCYDPAVAHTFARCAVSLQRQPCRTGTRVPTSVVHAVSTRVACIQRCIYAFVYICVCVCIGRGV